MKFRKRVSLGKNFEALEFARSLGITVAINIIADPDNERAEYAIMASCFNPYLEPQDMTAFRKLLDHFGVDYSLLPKEYCCGDPLYLHAHDEKHDGDLERADELGREFLNENNKITVIMITHDTGNIGEHAMKLMYMDVELVFFGTFDEFCHSDRMNEYFGGYYQHIICHRHR